MSSCLICRSPFEGGPGALCEECRGRMDRKGRKNPAPEGREEHTGLSQLDRVLEADRQKFAAQARKRATLEQTQPASVEE